jgi:hypothetical protein
MSHGKAHFALITFCLSFAGFADRVAAAELTGTPARLTRAVGEQTGLTDLPGRQYAIVH